MERNSYNKSTKSIESTIGFYRYSIKEITNIVELRASRNDFAIHGTVLIATEYDKSVLDFLYELRDDFKFTVKKYDEDTILMGVTIFYFDVEKCNHKYINREIVIPSSTYNEMMIEKNMDGWHKFFKAVRKNDMIKTEVLSRNNMDLSMIHNIVFKYIPTAELTNAEIRNYKGHCHGGI